MSQSFDNQDQINLLPKVESLLRTRIQKEEAENGKSNSKPPDSLWGHAVRVAGLAERIGLAEGVDPLACRLAGIFHDAGKFSGGCYHQDDSPEEQWSVAVLHDIAGDIGFSSALIGEVEDSILQLYRDDPDPTLLTKVLFDADNLDKLGPLGVANYCLKAGLRGTGLSLSFLHRITVELTYARHAHKCLATHTGKKIAGKRAPETISYFKAFLSSLREDGIYDFRVKEILYDGLIIDVVAPSLCSCGHKQLLKIWDVPGLKCSEIHLKHICDQCGFQHELRFCRPRLIESC